MSHRHLEELIEKYYPRIRRAALLMSGRPYEADDLAQETFLQALQGWDRFAGNSRVETWLYSILLRVHSKRRRSAGRAWVRWIRWFSTQSSPEVATVEQQLELQEWKESLWPAVSQLSIPQQQVLILRYSEDLSLTEIAEIMRCPLGTIKSRLHHALSALKNMFRDNSGIEKTGMGEIDAENIDTGTRSNFCQEEGLQSLRVPLNVPKHCDP